LPDSETSELVSAVPVPPLEEGFFRGPVRVAVLVHLEGRIESDVLSEALHRVQRRHPKLRAAITLDSTGQRRYEFGRVVAPIPVEIIDYDGEHAPWREETRRLLQLEPPPVGPVLAVTILRDRNAVSSHLILCAHHGIADGRSGIILAEHLLAEYANVHSNVQAPEIPALPLVSAPRARNSGGVRGKVRLLRRFVRLQRDESRTHQTLLPTGRDIPDCSQWVHWVFSREATLRLVRRCRKEQVASSGAFVAAVYCGLMDCLSVPEGLFKWHCPFSVRDKLKGSAGPVTDQDLGVFVGMMRGVFRIPQKPDFWDLARRAHTDIQGFVEQGGPAVSYNLSRLAINRFFTRYEPVLLPTSSKRPTLLFTNYGVLDMRNAYGPLRPKDCTLMFNGDKVTGPWLIMEALVHDQRLNIGFAGDGLDPVFWEQLHAAVRSHLDAVADSTATPID
jgi:hypothetical protein